MHFLISEFQSTSLRFLRTLMKTEQTPRSTGWTKKVRHYQDAQKIVLKPVIEIRFFGQIKV